MIFDVHIAHRREHQEAAAGGEEECRSPAQQVAARAAMERDVQRPLFIASECKCVRTVHVRAGCDQGWELEIVSSNVGKEQPKFKGPLVVAGTRAEKDAGAGMERTAAAQSRSSNQPFTMCPGAPLHRPWLASVQSPRRAGLIDATGAQRPPIAFKSFRKPARSSCSTSVGNGSIPEAWSLRIRSWNTCIALSADCGVGSSDREAHNALQAQYRMCWQA
jgi:hypothetical protein